MEHFTEPVEGQNDGQEFARRSTFERLSAVVEEASLFQAWQ